MPLAFTENCLVSFCEVMFAGIADKSRRCDMCAANPSTVVSFDGYPGEAEVKDIGSELGSHPMRCNSYLFPRGTCKQELVLPYTYVPLS